MAEVRKKQANDVYEKVKIKQPEKKTKKMKNENSKKDINSEHNGKKSFIIKFRIFCHGVKSEFDKVHWPTRENMIKYSIAVLFFMLFLSLFFYLIDIIFAFIQSLL